MSWSLQLPHSSSDRTGVGKEAIHSSPEIDTAEVKEFCLDLQGLGEWPKAEEEQARELLLKWEHLLTHSNLDLGRTALNKHQTEVTIVALQGPIPMHIPHINNDVKAHLQEILDIGAI